MKTRAVSVLLLLLLGVVACGGTTAPTDLAPAITVSMDDFSFSPREVRVAEGAEVTIEVRNIGDVVHSWVLLQDGVRVEQLRDYDESTALVHLEADEGKLASTTFTAPGPGTYQVICTITGHLSSGMEGSFVVG